MLAELSITLLGRGTQLSGDLGKRRVGFRHVGHCARCAEHRRGSMSGPIRFVAPR